MGNVDPCENYTSFCRETIKLQWIVCLPPGIPYIFSFLDITVLFPKRLTVNWEWIHWISENKIKKQGQSSGETVSQELLTFLQCYWVAVGKFTISR